MCSCQPSYTLFFFLMIRPPPRSTLTDIFPYTPLFRSLRAATARQQAELGFGQAELCFRVVDRDAVMAAEREFQTAVERGAVERRSEEHTSELQSLMRISYAVFCLKTKTQEKKKHN